MPTQTAQLELADSAPPDVAMPDSHVDAVLCAEHRFNTARGIVNAVLIAVPFWALFAFALYLLI
jgi:hypothetical protein